MHTTYNSTGLSPGTKAINKTAGHLILVTVVNLCALVVVGSNFVLFVNWTVIILFYRGRSDGRTAISKGGAIFWRGQNYRLAFARHNIHTFLRGFRGTRKKRLQYHAHAPLFTRRRRGGSHENQKRVGCHLLLFGLAVLSRTLTFTPTKPTSTTPIAKHARI